MLEAIKDKTTEIISLLENTGYFLKNEQKKHEYKVFKKENGSLLTELDIASDILIKNELTSLFGNIQVLSEENSEDENIQIAKNKFFFLLDPIDGTSCFNEGKEFTINLAFCIDKKPVLSFIHNPIKKTILFGDSKQAFKRFGGKDTKLAKIKQRQFDYNNNHLIDRNVKFNKNTKIDRNDVKSPNMNSLDDDAKQSLVSNYSSNNMDANKGSLRDKVKQSLNSNLLDNNNKNMESLRLAIGTRNFEDKYFVNNLIKVIQQKGYNFDKKCLLSFSAMGKLFSFIDNDEDAFLTANCCSDWDVLPVLPILDAIGASYKTHNPYVYYNNNFDQGAFIVANNNQLLIDLIDVSAILDNKILHNK